MDINVLGVTQLYAYLIGWWQYDNLWAVLRDTGIFAIPFIAFFVKSIIEPFISQEARAGSVTMVKRSLVGFFTMFMIFSLFCVPVVGIKVNEIKFSPQGGSVQTPLDNDSTFADNVPTSVKNVSDIQMPLGWYTLLNIVNGITATMFNGISDDINIRQAQQVATGITIRNAPLRQEYTEFVNDCYLPSYADLTHDHIPEGAKLEVKKAFNYAKGAQFNRTNNKIFQQYFYPKYRSKVPVEGFPFDPSQDTVAAQTQPYPEYARPMCDVWWPKLEAKLYDDINQQWIENNPDKNTTSVLDYFKNNLHWYSAHGSDDDYKSAIVQVFLQKATGGAHNLAQNYYTERDYDKHIGSDFQKTVGLQWQNYLGGLQGQIATLIDMLPLIQMFLMIGIFSILPIGLVAGQYRFKFVVTALFFIFALIFCTYEWHLVSYIDQYMIESFNGKMMNDPDSMQAQALSTLVGDSPSGYSTSNLEIIVNMVSAIMYVMFPTLMTALFTWAGFAVGGVLDSALSQGKSDSGQASKGFTAATQYTMSEIEKML